jgi:hypothetical protein
MTPARSRQRHVADGMTSNSSHGLQITCNQRIKNIKTVGHGARTSRPASTRNRAVAWIQWGAGQPAPEDPTWFYLAGQVLAVIAAVCASLGAQPRVSVRSRPRWSLHCGRRCGTLHLGTASRLPARAAMAVPNRARCRRAPRRRYGNGGTIGDI